MEERVEILKSEYERLVKADRILTALMAGGVDNWEFYDDAMSTIEESNDDD